MPIRNLFVIALTTMLSLACYSKAAKNKYASLFAEAITTIEQEALQNVPRDELFGYAMDGMTSKLDGHSRYIAGEMYKIFNEDLDQQFGGVGSYVETHPESGELMVLAPVHNGPAYNAGIQSGDIFSEIKGLPAGEMERGEAVELIRGPRGTTVEVVMRRGTVEKRYQLERDFIHEPSVHGDYRNKDGTWNYHLRDYPSIGYIRLVQFGSKSTEEIREALESIDDDVESLIIDLRNNPGGLLDSAIEICDMFLPVDQKIVSIRGRNKSLKEEYFARVQPVINPKKPVVVLINRDSASASEVVSACLQDHGRAVVIGETSWGKGTVQHVIPMQQGRSALKLTTASYWRPSGINIDRFDPEAIESGDWGVKPNPDMEIEMTVEEVFENWQRRSLSDLRGLLEPEILKQRDQSKILESPDKPLQKAIEFLNSQEMEKRSAA